MHGVNRKLASVKRPMYGLPAGHLLTVITDVHVVVILSPSLPYITLFSFYRRKKWDCDLRWSKSSWSFYFCDFKR